MVSPVSNASGKVALSPPLSPDAVFKKIDNGNKGYITTSDLASAIVQLSPEGLNLSQAEAQSLAKEAFKKIDTDNDGKVSQSEFKAAAPQNAPNGAPPSGRPAGPPPGPPPGEGAGGAQKTQGVSTTNATQSYDAADTNQDGTVSEIERLAYIGKQISSFAPGANSASANTEVANSYPAVDTYS